MMGKSAMNEKFDKGKIIDEGGTSQLVMFDYPRVGLIKKSQLRSAIHC